MNIIVGAIDNKLEDLHKISFNWCFFVLLSITIIIYGSFCCILNSPEGFWGGHIGGTKK